LKITFSLWDVLSLAGVGVVWASAAALSWSAFGIVVGVSLVVFSVLGARRWPSVSSNG